jgi:hypothetical protein
VSPYRIPSPPSVNPGKNPGGARPVDTELLPMMVTLWVASIARVAFGLRSHEIFGAEATLALLMVFFLPWRACCALAPLWEMLRGRSRE